MRVYPLFDGVTVMLTQLETHGFPEDRPQRDRLEINFCVNGRFESHFSSRDLAVLKPGDMAVSTFDGVHGLHSHSDFPLGYYEGVCITVDCAPAEAWMRRNVAPLACNFSALKENLLASQWYAVAGAGPRCEHVFRELFENLPYFDRRTLTLKALELFSLLETIPRAELSREYCSAEQLRLARHLRDHLLTNRNNYVSLACLAEEHQISVSHLQRLFRQIYGMPVYHYIREYRLEQAAVELLSSREAHRGDRHGRGLRQRQQIFRRFQGPLRRYPQRLPLCRRQRNKMGYSDQNGIVFSRQIWYAPMRLN